MACKCGDISGTVGTLLLEDAVNAAGFPIQVVDWGLVTKDGRAVVEPRPSWFDVSGGTGNAVDQGGGVYHYHLPITATLDPITEAFVIGDFSAVYRAFYTVERVDCIGGQTRCEFTFRQANACQGPTTFPEGWMVFTGSRALSGGDTNVQGIHAFAINDPKGTFITIFPFGSTTTAQRFATSRVEVHEDLSSQAWIYYVTRPPDHTINLNLRRVRLNGQTDTELTQPETGVAAAYVSAWYDAGAGKYLLLYRSTSNAIKKVYDDGAGLVQLQTGISALDLAFSADGQDYYYIVGNTVRRAPIEGGAFEVETGAIGAQRIMVTATAVYVRRVVAGIVSVRRYSLDLDSPVDIATTGNEDATNTLSLGYAHNQQTGEHLVHQKATSGLDGISRYDQTGVFLTEEYWPSGSGTIGGPVHMHAIDTDDDPFPVANRVSKIYLAAAGVPAITKADADGTVQEDIDTDSGRTGSARGIAYDQAADEVYFCNEVTDIIYKEGNDGAGPVAWASAQDQVFSIAIDQANSHVYFSMKGEGGKIKRANLGGATAAGITDIITGEGTGIRHISLDVAGGKLYWANQTSGLVKRSNLNGSSVETVETVANAYTVCVEPGAGTHFYFATTGSAIHRRLKSLAAASEQVFLMTNHISGPTNPRQMVIDPDGLWIYFVTTSRIWRFLHSMSGLGGNTGLTLLHSKSGASFEGVALQLV